VGAINRARQARALGVSLLAAFMAQGALAQTVTGAAIAQELQRQIERERALREQQESAPDVRLLPPVSTDLGRLPEGETPCFPIREIALKSPVPYFDWAREAADPADDPATGRCLGSTGINLVMAARAERHRRPWLRHHPRAG
jgi:hemolysin activation/secretion protein